MMTYIKLSGLTCPACKKLTEKRIAAINGINNVNVDLSSGKAEIESEKVIPTENIKKALIGTPYKIID